MFQHGLATPPPENPIRTSHPNHLCRKTNSICGHVCREICSPEHQHGGPSQGHEEGTCHLENVVVSIKQCMEVDMSSGRLCECAVDPVQVPYHICRNCKADLTTAGEQKCSRRCKHLRCDLPCYVPCEIAPCDKPCDKTLSCGHNCPSGTSHYLI